MPEPEPTEEVKEFLEKAEEVPDPVTVALMDLANRQEALNNDLITLNKRLDEYTTQRPDPTGPAEFAGGVEEVEIAQEETPAPTKPAGKKRKLKFGKRRS